MKLRTLVNLIRSGQSSLMIKLIKTSNEFYRAVFVSTACSQGIYDKFVNGKSTFDQLCDKLDVVFNREGLIAWLELGVKLGELERLGNEYRIKGRLSRESIKPDNDAYRAVLEEIVKLHYDRIINTPDLLKSNQLFPFDESTGELIARSSRIAEPFIWEAVDEVIPEHGKFRLLEVGCGSGIYMRKACEKNPDLTAIGLEMQEKVASFAAENITSWGLDQRVAVEHCNVQQYAATDRFDLVTLHQNIYYFPVEERVGLAKTLIKFLRPSGQLLITSICQDGSPGFQALNLWCATTRGFGPLPEPDQLCRQLEEAGFSDLKRKRLIPFDSFWSFVATRKDA